MKEIYIATSNPHKVKEFKEMLTPLNIEVKSMLDLSIDEEIVENGTSFEENALIKARYLAKKLNRICVADDSGLEVDCLNKEPGIYSARYMGNDTSYRVKNEHIIKLCNQHTDRTCRFVCAMAICYPDQSEYVFTGTIEGTIAHEIIGEHGFGYDPIFYYEPEQTTLANIDPVKKNKISHRYNALCLLLEHLNA
ncbi:MAG: RdgB/HAM1 family non-canonical purine NTP pyrophosphatase [Erysipelotrichaceae bacterium]